MSEREGRGGRNGLANGQGNGASRGEAKPTLRLPRPVSVSIHIAALVLGAGALYFGMTLFLPLVLAVLGALTLSPITRSLARRGLPPALSAPVIVLGLALALGVGMLQLRGPFGEWVARAPEISRELQLEFERLRWSFRAVEEASRQVDEATKAASDPTVAEVVVREPGFLAAASTGALNVLTTLGLATLIALFLLAAGDHVHQRIVHVLPRFHEKKTALRIVRDIERSVSRYLLTITLINCGLGVAVATAMWIVGMPTPILWGVMATVLNFMPYLGAILGAGIVGAIALVTFDTLPSALLVPAVYIALTATEGNVVTPLVLGRRLDVNPVAILIGVTFWGWIWGPVGVLIAVPILVVVKTIGDHLPSWHVIATFLGGPPTIDEDEEDEPPPRRDQPPERGGAERATEEARPRALAGE